jgi:glutamine synthetase
MLAAGLDGIEKDMQPPAPVEENIYDFNNDELTKRQIGSVAANLEDALNHLAENSVIRAALGEHTYESFDRLKRSEWDSYRMHVTDWEKENYLPLY